MGRMHTKSQDARVVDLRFDECSRVEVANATKSVQESQGKYKILTP